MCTRAPSAAQPRSSARSARALGSRRARRKIRRVVARRHAIASGGSAPAGDFGVHEQRQRRAAPASAAPAADPLRSTLRNSSTPEGTRKHLKPRTPASTSASSSLGVAGHDAAPEADVDVALSRAPRRLRRRAPPRVVVAGTLLSGMSTSVVTPPAAAARVAVSKPSHSVRPGSLMCTCVSTTPGDTTRSGTLNTRAPVG